MKMCTCRFLLSVELNLCLYVLSGELNLCTHWHADLCSGGTEAVKLHANLRSRSTQTVYVDRSCQCVHEDLCSAGK